MAKIDGNDVNMMPGFMVVGLSCFGMPYGAANAGWIEVERPAEAWTEINPISVLTKYLEPDNASGTSK